MIDLRRGDCLDIMRTLPDKSIGAIICDLPYGKTRNAWDKSLPLDALWTQYKRIIRPGGAIVLTAVQPFTSLLIVSNLKWFKWTDVWHKSKARGFLNARVMPLREHEDIVVFGKGRVTYNPQITKKDPRNVRPLREHKATTCYNGFAATAHSRTIALDESYPRSVVTVPNANCGESGLHPTQKPLALLRYLVLTFSNPDDVVLDNCMGSGTTGVACIEARRDFVGIELDADIFDIARRRIMDVSAEASA